MNKWIIISVIVIGILLLLRFLICKAFYKCALLNDILKEKTEDGTIKYSQGRVYLLGSILAYLITLGILTGKALKPNIGIDSNTVTQVIDALQWVILLMAGYVFGGKGLEIAKLLLSAKINKNNNNQNPPTGS